MEKTEWEEELGIKITNEEWEQMFNEIHKTTPINYFGDNLLGI